MKNTFFIIYITAKLKTMKQQWMTLVWGVMVLLFSSCGDTKEEFYKLKYCSTVVYMVPRA